MKRLALVISVVAAAMLSAGLAAGADGPGKLVLKVYEKKPVAYDHAGHAKRIGNCQKCHHQDSAGSEVKCSECHQAKRDGSTPSFREAMHYRCKNCHMADRKKVKGSCGECHAEMRPKKSEPAPPEKK